MTEDLAAQLGIIAFCSYLAYGVARWAAEIDPLEWSAVCAVALLIALVGYPIMLLTTGRLALVAMAAFVLAVMVGANLGLGTRDQGRRDNEARHTRTLAYVATLGPCADCASGDLQRRPCDECGVVHCDACSLRHRPYRDGRQSPCPTSPATRARPHGAEEA